MKLLQTNTVHGTALGAKDNADIKSKRLHLQSNQTDSYSELKKVENRVDELNASILQSNQTDSYSELKKVENRVDELYASINLIEKDKNTNMAAIQENSDALTIAVTKLEEQTLILQNISTTLDVLTSTSLTQLNDNNPYNDSSSRIEASIYREIKIKTAMNTLLESNLTYKADARHFV